MDIHHNKATRDCDFTRAYSKCLPNIPYLQIRCKHVTHSKHSARPFNQIQLNVKLNIAIKDKLAHGLSYSF